MWCFRKRRPDDKKWNETNIELIRLAKEGKVDNAVGLAHELFKYSRTNYGKRHEKTITALNNLGFVHILKKDFDAAESYLLMAIQVSEKVFGRLSREAAMVNVNLSKLYAAKAREIQGIESLFDKQPGEGSKKSVLPGQDKRVLMEGGHV